VPYFTVGWDILWKAIRNICHGQVFDENFLMVVASIGAFGTKEFSEAVGVMLFYQVGELFQSYAVNRSRQNIADLMDIAPEFANVERDGEIESVDPDEVSVGETIVVKPGERIPLDGVVLSGTSMVDTSALTGESEPRSVAPGENVISGCVNGSGLLRVEVTSEFENSTVARILELVENASSKKAKTENFITKFAKYYTPAVVIAAVILGVLPPLILSGGWGDWIRRACTFLVISCPCALVISVPMSFFGGIGGASRHGILIKGGNYLEALREVKTIVFDKTGTLTQGRFAVQRIYPEGCTEDELLELAALAESSSEHPIARSICEAYTGKIDPARITDVQEIPGHGLKVAADGHTILAGNSRLMEGIQVRDIQDSGTVVHVAQDGKYMGAVTVADGLKPTSAAAISGLRELSITTVMLTGDRKETAAAVAAELGVDRFEAELLPQDKVAKVEELEKSAQQQDAKVAFVGDGINDAPVLARADVGVAMGSMGSDAAIEAADVVLMDDDPKKLLLAMKFARKTMAIVKQNIVFALGVKAVVLVLGALGVATMWEAVFADVGVAVIAILNAMRAMSVKTD
jgi:Cd2+/Zn2+-exporting ATPase